MSTSDISAFAAFAKTKRKKKKNTHLLDLNDKSKIKLKKKEKHKLLTPELVQATVANGGAVATTNFVKPMKKKKKVETLLKAQIKSVFGSTSEENGSSIGQNHLSSTSVDSISTDVKNNDVKDKVQNKKKKLLLDRTQNNLGKDPIQPKEKKKKSSEKMESSVGMPNQQTQNQVVIYSDSVKLGEEVFSWLLSPMEIKDFFNDCWEKKPLHITRNDENFFKYVCTLEDLKTALAEKEMYFTKNIDVTSYVNGERFTENPEGKATLPIVWDFFNSGKSIRLLNPQTFIPNVTLLLTHLQEFFHCFVGANIYLTPAGTQGFAPHYDDIEAFVLQLEGEKHWKLYDPRMPGEVLPRDSSKNFKENEIGKPIMEVTLKPGDLLYFPRGIIHQAKCSPLVHSLHVTVSCYQRNSWADLFEKVFPVALERAISEDVELRKGLPLGYLNHLGLVYADGKTELRRHMLDKFKELAQRILDFCPLDAAVDQLAVDFTHSALPPCLTDEEKLHGGDRTACFEDKSFLNALRNHGDKNLGVKLIRATSVRLVSEDEEMYLYYTTDNPLVYRENEVMSVSVPVTWTLAIEHLIRSYPNFVDMKALPVVKKGEKPGKWRRIADFVYFLWQRGLVLFDKPQRAIYS